MEAGKVIALGVMLLMLLPPVSLAQEPPTRSTGSETWELLDELQKEVRIAPGGSYCAWYDNSTRQIADNDVYSNLTAKANAALEKVPAWLESDLALKFCEIGSGMDVYANLILNAADPRYVDEIAFAVAHTSPEILKSPSFDAYVFSDNAASIYDADRYLDYVNITEKADYTTATYTNAAGAKVELPREIYYWYIVHPKITDETPQYINPSNGAVNVPPSGKFWRDYLLNHNDAGYPLLRDALAGVPTLWNGIKNSCTDNGAVGVITKWILDVMDFGSGAERPTQPVRIYALHLGRCGEHEDITAAAARAALIPCIGAEDIAEDHVWNEFWYDGAWHQWEPVNVYVDFPESYGGWGKKFPAVNGWRGDDYMWTETAMYTQTATLRIAVKDKNGLPIDGATVWIGSEYPGNAAYRMMASWNSTNETGVTEFLVGKGNNIYARVDTGKAGGAPTASPSSTGANPYVLFAMDTSLVVTNASAMTYNYTFSTSGALAPRKLMADGQPLLNGSYMMEISARVTGSEVKGRSALGAHYFMPAVELPAYSFITDFRQYSSYTEGRGFTSYSLDEGTDVQSAATMPKAGEMVAVVGNDAAATIKTVMLTVKCYVSPYIGIDEPRGGALISGGGLVRISGRADGVNITSVKVNTGGPDRWLDGVHRAGDRQWSFEWNTSGLPSGNYTLTARLDDGLGATDSAPVTVFLDADDPSVTVAAGGILRGGTDVELSGTARDNLGVTKAELEIWGPGETGARRPAILDADAGTWSFVWPTSGLGSGEFVVSVFATDIAGRTAAVSGNITLDFEAPELSLGTAGLFRGGEPVRLEGMARDDVKLWSVTVFEGGRAYAATLAGDRWSFDWDTTGLASGRYTITALAEDFAGWNASAASTIELDADAPGIELEVPESAESGAAVTLAGTLRDKNTVASAELSTDGGNWTELAPDGNGDFTFSWDTSALMPGNFTVSVRAYDTLGNNVTVSRTVRLVDTTAPQISMDIPRDAQAGETITLNAKLVERTGIERVEYSTDGNEWSGMTPGAKGYSVQLDTRTLALGKNRIRVRAFDLAGNLGESSKDVTVTDDLAPALAIWDLRVEKSTLTARGNASDNYRLRAVEYTVDGIRWKALEPANGSWNLSLAGLKAGKYTLKVRATDQAGKTAETARDFNIEGTKTSGKGFIPGFDAGLLAAALMAGTVALTRKRKRR